MLRSWHELIRDKSPVAFSRVGAAAKKIRNLATARFRVAGMGWMLADPTGLPAGCFHKGVQCLGTDEKGRIVVEGPNVFQDDTLKGQDPVVRSSHS